MDDLPSLSFCNVLCAYVCQHSACQVVVKLENIKQHLQRKHRIGAKKSREHAEDLQRAADGKTPQAIAARYFQDPYPKVGEQPLPALPLLPVYDVIKCPYCELYFRGVSSCRNHLNGKHRNSDGLVSAIGKLQESTVVKGQALYLGGARVLFPVTVKAADLLRGEYSYLSILDRDENKQRCTTQSDEISVREKSANISCEILGIPSFLDLQGLTLERSYEISKTDTSFNREGISLMLDYIQHFAASQPAIPMSVIEGLKIRHGGTTASFSLHIEMRSKRRYAEVATRILGLVSRLRSYNLQSCPLGAELLSAGEDIARTLSMKQPTALPQVHQFFRSLLLQQVKVSDGENVALEGIFKLLMAGYTCSVRSKRVRVGDSEDASHTAAALQYFCHIAALGEFLKHPKGFGERIAEDEATRFNRIRSLISTETCTPAAYIRDVLKKTKHVSAGESPKIQFVQCPKHPLCGFVDNIEVPLNSEKPGSIGYTVRKLSTDVRQILRKELMREYNTPPAFLQTMLSFPDRLNEKEPGYYFGEGVRAKETIRAWSEDFTRHLIGGPRPILELGGSPASQEWRPTRYASEWLREIDKISVLLYMLFHLCGGGPPRVTEMLDAKLKNVAGSRRNVYIVKQSLAIIGSYSKISRQYTTPKPIARFLDPGTSELILLFVVYIKPVQCFILNKSMVSVRATEDYLFCQSGEKMRESVIRRMFASTMASAGLPLNVSLYRQHRAGVAKAFLTTEDTSDMNEEVVFQQAGHTESTARTRYAAGDFNVGTLSLAKLERFYKVSTQWHTVIGILKPSDVPSRRETGNRIVVEVDSSIEKGVEGSRQRKPMLEGEANQRKRVVENQGVFLETKRRNRGTTAPIEKKSMRIRCGSLTESILAAAARILRKSSMVEVQFNSEAQRSALFECSMHTVLHDYQSSMIVILPTGGGKTLCWAAPARREQDLADESSSKAPITILVLPLIALQQDMVRKCGTYGVRCGLWSERFRDDITVVVCAIDVVFTNEYARYVTALSVQGFVARIVLDECHLILLWEYFRKFSAIGCRIRPAEAQSVPIVCLTATLPGAMVQRLTDILCLDISCLKLYRATNSRPNLSYEVQHVPFQTSERMIETCSTLAADELLRMSQAERMIVFCLTVNDCVTLFQRLKGRICEEMVCMYHGSMSHQEREKNFNSWVSAASAKPIAMIATSAFSCGIDYPHVRMVLHVGGARNIVELAQESGRAGRDGMMSRSVIVFNNTYMQNRTESGGTRHSPLEKERDSLFGDIKTYIRGCCRRESMESFLNYDARGPCNDREIKCDVCTYFETSGWKQICLEDLRTEEKEFTMGKQTASCVKQVTPQHVTITKHTENDSSGRAGSIRNFWAGRLEKIEYGKDDDFVSVVKWKAKQISLLKCAICLFQGKKGCGGKNMTICMRGMCFRCLERNASHQSSECQVTPRSTRSCKRCFFCGIPEENGFHEKSTFNKGDSCEWLVAKNLTLLSFRAEEHRKELLNRIPNLRHAHSLKEVGLLLCGGKEKRGEVHLAQAVDYLYSTFVLRSDVANN